MKSQWIILTALILSTSAIHSVQSCSAWDWVKCGGVLVGCATACVVTDGELCIECLGPLYHQCVSCFKVAAEINALVTLQGALGQNCSAFDWVECGSKLFECEAACDDDLTAPKCTSCVGDTYSKCIYCLPPIAGPKLIQTEIAQPSKCSTFTKIKCAAKVAECAATCGENGITSSKCIKCFGSAYQKCKGCLPFHTAVKSVNLLQGCSSLGWLRCAGRLPSCTTECIDRGFNSPQCFHCLGSNFNPCNTCISAEDIEDMQQLGITQQAARANGVPKFLGRSATLK